MSETELRLPAPLPHQVPVLAHPARFKVWRAGRRTGKSRLAFLAAIAGHGPGRTRKGVMQGGDVVWLAPDYPQSQAIWREEVKPRFAGLPWATINESQRRVEVRGLGSLEIRSAEAIDGIRGRRLDGVIFDEGAYFDAEYAWNAVVRPALADREGWAIFGSTTNSGHDGNQLKRVPSFFNVLCERIAAGELSEDWHAFHNRTRDNPKIPPGELDALYAEYPPGSAVAAQELDADLGVAGGRYYEAASADVHLVPRDALPSEWPEWWKFFGSYDWGFAHWSPFLAWAWIGEDSLLLLDTLWMRREQDEDYARQIVEFTDSGRVPVRCRKMVFAGRDCWAKVRAHAASGVTVADVFLKHGIRLLEADDDRANGGRAVRRALAYTKADDGRIVEAPAVRMVDTPGNRLVLQSLERIVPDHLDINKPGKVNADADGRGGDDGADAFRYGVATWPKRVKEPDDAPIDVNDPKVLQANYEQAYKLGNRLKRKRQRPLDGMFGGF